VHPNAKFILVIQWLVKNMNKKAEKPSIPNAAGGIGISFFAIKLAC